MRTLGRQNPVDGDHRRHGSVGLLTAASLLAAFSAPTPDSQIGARYEPRWCAVPSTGDVRRLRAHWLELQARTRVLAGLISLMSVDDK